MTTRCAWCGDDPLYQAYHDHEWGKPVFDDKALFAMLCLEGMQAGLNWLTVLKKRDAYYQAFAHFEPAAIAEFDEQQIDALMQNPNLIRHRGKLQAIVKNARAFLRITEQQSFCDYLWAMSPNGLQKIPLKQQIDNISQVPTQSAYSQAMAKQLKKDGFSFVGATTCYAFMQAVGMVNDHWAGCDFR